MTEEKEPIFRDFTLTELSHLDLYQCFKKIGEKYAYSVYGWQNWQNERLAFGRAQIDQHTKPGDMVALETPEFMTSEEVKKFFGNKVSPDILDEVQEFMNFYHKLARYAESVGRKVVSLEPSSMKHGGKLAQLGTKVEQLEKDRISRTDRNFTKTEQEFVDRGRYLTGLRRDIAIQKRIQIGKPKLVIAAARHALDIIGLINPTKVIFHNPAWLEYGKITPERANELRKKYLETKFSRLVQRRKEIGIKKEQIEKRKQEIRERLGRIKRKPRLH
ncbi:MAG: hypothetical protein Q7K42_06255 [Candidatus Diapherotrites archaeon]|nr:hypothetical protein [Candidatus Diapherotrites archaeon]